MRVVLLTGNELRHKYFRVRYLLGDSPSSAGNRVIREKTRQCGDLITRFRSLAEQPQPDGKVRVYRIADFDAAACEALYERFRAGVVEEYLHNPPAQLPNIVSNPAMESVECRQ